MELQHLCRFTAYISRPEIVADTPRGRFLVGGIKDGRLEGDRLRASQRGTSAADWLIIGTDGTALVDVRISFRTDDGAFLYMDYRGRGDWSKGSMTGPVFSAHYCESEDPRYHWLHTAGIFGYGAVAEGNDTYDIGFNYDLYTVEAGPVAAG